MVRGHLTTRLLQPVAPLPTRVLDALLGIGCRVCGEPGDVVCRVCRAGLRRVRGPAVFAYDDTARPLVLLLKTRGDLALAAWAADELAHGVRGVDAVVPVAARRDGRGFDHADLLARALARRLDVPYLRVFTARPAAQQRGRGRAARLRSVAAAHLRPRALARLPRRIVLVDDVRTTGATLRAGARALPPGVTVTYRTLCQA